MNIQLFDAYFVLQEPRPKGNHPEKKVKWILPLQQNGIKCPRKLASLHNYPKWAT